VYIEQCTPDEHGQNGREPSQPPPPADAAPEKLDHDTLVEYVRSWTVFRLKETSLRDLETETSVAKSSIDKFVKRQALPSKIWPKLRQWYLTDRRARGASLQDPADMALLMLESLVNVPDDRVAEALLRTADYYEELHRQLRAPMPDWIDSLRRMAREGMAATQGTNADYPVPKRRGRKKKDPGPGTPEQG
jgi:hypothetical protein